MEMVQFDTIAKMRAMEPMTSMNATSQQVAINTDEASFLDIFSSLASENSL